MTEWKDPQQRAEEEDAARSMPFCEQVDRWLHGDAPQECRECEDGKWAELSDGSDRRGCSTFAVDGGADSREKLEADVRRYANPRGDTGTLGARWEQKMLEFLDRQAAITANETSHDNPYVGLVRGKQWERTEVSDYYCGRCGWKVTDHDSYCPECGGALHRATNRPTSQSDAPKTDETAENGATKSEMLDFDDSREKLEADVRKRYTHTVSTAMWPPSANKHTDMVSVSIDTVLGWLDRQEAITEREVARQREEQCAQLVCDMNATRAERDKWVSNAEVGFERIKELEAERDNIKEHADRQRARISEYETLYVGMKAQRDALQEKVDELELRERCASDYDFRQAAERWEEAYEDKCAELHLMAEERDEWKTKCETHEVAYKQADAERKRYSKQIDELFAERDELKAERDEAVEAYDAHMDAHDAWHEAEDIEYTRNRFAIYEQATKEQIARLESERDELMLKLAGKPKCEVCDRTTMLTEIEGLTEERDYWKQQVQRIMDAAYPASHSPEPAYAPELMNYQPSQKHTDPATMVGAVIDGLRDERSEQYMAILKESEQVRAERDHWRRVASEHAEALRTVWLKGADGEPLRIGDARYGEDGTEWRVTGFRWGSSHPVQGVDPEGRRRDLKPEWLRSERPDSWERVRSELGCLMANLGMYGSKYAGDPDAELDAILERARRLAGGSE